MHESCSITAVQPSQHWLHVYGSVYIYSELNRSVCLCDHLLCSRCTGNLELEILAVHVYGSCIARRNVFIPIIGHCKLLVIRSLDLLHNTCSFLLM